MAEEFHQTFTQNTSTDNPIIDSDAVPISLAFNATETPKIEHSEDGTAVTFESELFNFMLNKGSASAPFQRGCGAPPFLTKTYDMVDDPSIDAIVSWNNEADGFIVWDSKEFCCAILPQYFKHNNFSSFIRQLNIYGFKKVDHDRWEFAHKEFQKGKRDSLKNIKRRKRDINIHREAKAFTRMAKLELHTQIESLKRGQNMLSTEIMKMKQQQESCNAHVAAFEDRFQSALQCHKKLVLFFEKAMWKMMQNKRKGKEMLGYDDMVKKRRLNGDYISLGLNIIDQDSGQSKLMNGHYEQGSSSTFEEGTNVGCGTSDPNWEKMTEELLGINEDEVVFDESNTSKLLRELESLIHKPKDWIVEFLESEF